MVKPEKPTFAGPYIVFTCKSWFFRLYIIEICSLFVKDYNLKLYKTQFVYIIIYNKNTNPATLVFINAM